jgi:hypothetical protein
MVGSRNGRQVPANRGRPAPRPTPIGAVIRGAVAGAIGTAAMDAVWYARYRHGGGPLGPIAWDLSEGLEDWESAPAPAQVGKRVVEGFLQRPLKPERARAMNNLVHWAYGISWGAAYGVAAGSLRDPKARLGLLFGPAVWSTAYVVLPPSGLYEPITSYDAATLWKDASAHLAFGLGTALAFRWLLGVGRSRLRGR